MKRTLMLVLFCILSAILSANAILGKSIKRPLYAPNIVKLQLSETALQRSNLPRGLYAESESFGLPELDEIKSELGNAKIIRAHISLKDKEFERKHGVDRWFLVKYNKAIDVSAAILKFKGSSYIEKAIPEYIAYSTAIPNDPYYASNWGHNNTAQLPAYTASGHTGPGVGIIGFDTDMQAAWDLSQGYGLSSVVIGIIDTGVDTAHPDLRLVAGYDYGDNDSNPMDDCADPGHGTACSGIAAGMANNALGITGVAGGCSVMPLKIADSAGDMYFTYIENALYHCADNNVDVASMSFGAEGGMAEGESPSTDTALEYAYSHGVTLLAATANRDDPTIAYPSNHNKVISVGAASPSGERKSETSSDGENWWGSNYGVSIQDNPNAVDVMAPTILPTTDITGTGNGYSINSDYYMWFNGTSCATPYAAGIAALLISNDPNLSPAQVRETMVSTCTDMTVDGGAGWDRFTGYGLLNANSALLILELGIPRCHIEHPVDGSLHELNSQIPISVNATDSDGSISNVKFYVDGVLKYTDSSYPYAWTWDTSAYSAGSYTITALATDNSSNTANNTIQISLITPADEGFESGDLSALPWITGSASAWTVQNNQHYCGSYAAQAGDIGDYGTSSLSINLDVSTAGDLSFSYKVSSENGYDFLSFYIDDSLQAQWSGDIDWTIHNIAVASGEHTFRWTYSKDSSVDYGEDSAWLDHIVFPEINQTFPPTNLSGSAVPGSVNLSWNSVLSDNISGFNIYRDDVFLAFSPSTAYTDATVVTGISYTYYVTALYGSPAVESAPSNSITICPGMITADYNIGSGSGSNDTDEACPINSYYKSLHGQSVYTAAELNAAGISGPIEISRIGFDVSEEPESALPNFIIRMKHSADVNAANWQSAAGMQTVYTNAAYMPDAGGYDMLVLDPPFSWNGVDNLVVDTAFSLLQNWSYTGRVKYSTLSNGYRYVRNDGSDQTNVFSGGSTTSKRPNIRLSTQYMMQIPRIEVSHTAIDFGTVLINTAQSSSFTISNPGNAPLSGSITVPTGYSVSADSRANRKEGLSLSRLSGAASRNTITYSVDPGESLELFVSFSPTAVQAYLGDLEITHNAEGMPRSIALSGQGGKPELVLSDNAFSVDLGPGEESTRTLTISNAGNMTLDYSIAKDSSVSWLELNGGESVNNVIVSGGSAQQIEIAFSSVSLPVGSYSATISGTSNDPDYANFNIAIAFNVKAPLIQISSTSLDFGMVPVGESADSSFTISNPGNDTLEGELIWNHILFSVSEDRIEGHRISAKQDSPEAREYSRLQPSSLAFSIPGGDSRTFTVSFYAAEMGEYNATIQIVSNAADAALSLQLSAIGVQAVLLHYPNLIEVDIAFGESATEGIQIENNGNIPLIYTIARAPGSSLLYTINGSYSPVEGSLAPGGRASISLGIHADIEESEIYQAVDISCNDSDNPFVRIPIVVNTYNPNHAPLLNLPDSISMDMNGYLLQDFTAYISDPDDDETTLGVSGNSNVSVSIQGYEVSFSPLSDWYGEETITFTLSDGNLETSDDVLMIVNYVVYELDVPEPIIMVNMNGISISWQAVTDAQEYHIYRSDSPDGPFELIEVTNNTFYLESTIEDKAFYYIKAAVPAISVKQ
ncbi:MAG: S8 family serine peptidase [Candidatus Cloacimonadaceae bacterium]|nr:S8 family serine peptidase [Candidatus Cloacimonadaceae bacterium]